MNRIDRLMGMLTLLQAKKYVSAQHLADAFEISIRTVYRDIRALGEINIPIGFENNKGYFVVEGYFLPPVSFTTAEANALILMEAMARRFTDQSIQRHCESALNKIKSVLKSSEKEKVEHLHSQTKTYLPPGLSTGYEYLSEIQAAVANQTQLNIDYQNNEGTKSNRNVEPIGLVFYSMHWHMIAWCWLRNEYRDFKVAHIQKLQVTGIAFLKNNHINVNDYIKSLA